MEVVVLFLIGVVLIIASVTAGHKLRGSMKTGEKIQEDFPEHLNAVGIRACLLTVEQTRDLEAKIHALNQIIKYAEQLKRLAKGER